MPFEIIDGLRRKVRSLVTKDKSVLDPETGEVISDIAPDGSEVLDQTPVSPPISVTRERSMFDHHREFIRSELLAMRVQEEGFETFAESEDFDVPDDVPVDSPWENEFDPGFNEIQEALKADKAGRGVKTPPVEPSSAPKPGEALPEPLNEAATPGDGAK